MRPLSDVRILAVEQFGAGPFASLQLAELGAEVIKIEDPAVGGDVGRYVPPYAEGGDSLFFESFNRNKRSIFLDIGVPSGRIVFEDLVTKSDAVLSNVRGDLVEKLQISFEDLRRFNPKIVCCSLSAFGRLSSRAHEPGYDYVLQGLTGWMDLTGEPEGVPTKTGPSLVDYSGGFVAAISLLAGLHSAGRDGIGTDCDVALFDTAISLLTYLATWHLTADYVPIRARDSAHPSLVPFQNFRTSDGWIVVACAKEKFWRRLVDVLDLPDLASDERFSTFAGRRQWQDELVTRVGNRFKECATDIWLDRLRAEGVPCGRVNTVTEALADPFIAERNMAIEVPHPRFGPVREIASAVRVGPPGADRGEYRRAPRRDEDASYVLKDILGYDASRIDALVAAGAFGPGKDSN